MKLQFLGTGAAEGAPALFCNCNTCKELRARKEYHTRAQYLIDGVLGIDFPADAYFHALNFNVDLAAMRYLIITHSHIDHFNPLDFVLRGYKYADGDHPLTIYGNREVLEVFAEGTKREMKDCVAKNFTLVEMQLFQPLSFGQYTVIPLSANHANAPDPFVFWIEKEGKAYLHLTDTGRLPTDTLEYLEKVCRRRGKAVDFVTFDCTFLRGVGGENSRHMGLEDNRAMQSAFLRLGIANEGTRYAITHYSHNSAPFKENLYSVEEEYGYISAYDGLTIEI